MVTVAVRDENSLPIPDAFLLLANDLVGGLVVPLLITTAVPLSYNPITLKWINHICFLLVLPRGLKPKRPLPPPKIILLINLNLLLLLPLQLHFFQTIFLMPRKRPDLISLHAQAISKGQISRPPSFCYHQGVLIRLYRPSKLADEDSGYLLNSIGLTWRKMY